MLETTLLSYEMCKWAQARWDSIKPMTLEMYLQSMPPIINRRGLHGCMTVTHDCSMHGSTSSHPEVDYATQEWSILNYIYSELASGSYSVIIPTIQQNTWPWLVLSIICNVAAAASRHFRYKELISISFPSQWGHARVCHCHVWLTARGLLTICHMQLVGSQSWRID